ARQPYTADVFGLVAEPGCAIRVPAKIACVPSTKTNVEPSLPASNGPTPNSFVCYKMRCPKTTLPAIDVADQFGNRNVTPTKSRLVCAPMWSSSTTTVVTTTSMTTTSRACECDASGCCLPTGGYYCS